MIINLFVLFKYFELILLCFISISILFLIVLLNPINFNSIDGFVGLLSLIPFVDFTEVKVTSVDKGESIDDDDLLLFSSRIISSEWLLSGKNDILSNWSGLLVNNSDKLFCFTSCCLIGWNGNNGGGSGGDCNCDGWYDGCCWCLIGWNDDSGGGCSDNGNSVIVCWDIILYLIGWGLYNGDIESLILSSVLVSFNVSMELKDGLEGITRW